MTDAPSSPDRPQDPVPTEPLENASTQPPPQSPPTDWRLFAIIGVVVLLIVAAAVNRGCYSDIDTPPQDNVFAPGEPPSEQPSAAQQQDERTFLERYADMKVFHEFQAQRNLLMAQGRTYTFAQPAHPIPKADQPDEIDRFEPIQIFDITDRVDGIKPAMLHRRMIPVSGGERVQSVWKDTYPALGLSEELSPVYAPAAEAGDRIGEDDSIIGVVSGEKARAYPVKIANYFELINDRLADGPPFVLAWSALAGAASAMTRPEIDGNPLVFGSSGLIYQGAIVMYDPETLSLWDSVGRRCIAGPETGRTLAPLPVQITSWQTWKSLHPNTDVLADIEGPLTVNYGFNPAVPSPDYYQNPHLVYPVYGFDLANSPLHAKQLVIGVTLDGTSRAYALRALREAGEEVADSVGEKALTIRCNPETNIINITTTSGDPVFFEQMFWLYWAAAHPDTEVWQREKMPFPYRVEAAAPDASVPDLPDETLK